MEKSEGQGKMKVNHQIEEMDQEENIIAEALSLFGDNLKPLKLKGLSVYR